MPRERGSMATRPASRSRGPTWRLAVSARRKLAATVLAVAVCSGGVHARPEAADAEIRHLLEFVTTSHCIFVRSGVEYPPSEARTHLQRKLDYAGERIQTADEFVIELASRSSTTGAEYRVRCGTEELSSRRWLSTELDRFRKEFRGTRR